MSPARLALFPLMLLLAVTTCASAQNDPGSRPIPGVSPQGIDQVVYKGIVGNVLDTIPMDSAERLQLQRTSAVVSNTLFGRSLNVLAGLSNPVLLLGGFVWGIWAASNIKPAEAGIKLAADSGQPAGGSAEQERIATPLDGSPGVDDEPANRATGNILASSISGADSNLAAPPRVVRLWLPQHSAVLPR